MARAVGEIEVRSARADEVEQLVALCAQVLDEEDVPALLADIEREGPERFTVAVADGRVVSSLGLLSWRLRVGTETLPVGVIEYVMTLPEHRGRGLVRAQVDLAHRWSAKRGDLLQMILGIPYLYRRFGYGYALAQGPRHQLRRGADTRMPVGWSAREAAKGDEEALRAVHDTAQATADVALVRDLEDWHSMLRTLGERNETVLVVEGPGGIGGYGRMWEAPDRNFVFEAGASSLAAARALLAAAVAHGGPSGFSMNDRPGTPISALLLDAGLPLDSPYQAFVRVPDVVALLDGLRPVLSARLSASAFADEEGELRVTTFSSGARLAYAAGQVTEVAPAEPLHKPKPGVLAVAPDLLPGLVLGASDPLELEASQRDVEFMECRGLVAALFPRMVTSVTWPA